MNIFELDESLRSENPCWKGYHPVGTKKKNGRTVPNCVPNANEDVSEGVAETVPMNDAVKVLRHYGAGNFKTTSNELHFYKNGQPMSVDLIWGDGGERSVSLSQLNSVSRQLKGQGVAEGLPQTLRKVVPGYAKREIDKKMDAGKFGKTDADKDANFQRYKKIQDKIKEQGVEEGEKNPHTSALGKALYRALSKEKKASPQQVQRNKERWAQRQAAMVGDPAPQHYRDELAKDAAEYRKKHDVEEAVDSYEFHTSVPVGKFMPSKYGNEKYLYLHDTTRKSGSGTGPMLVTVERPGTAKEIAVEYGGKVVKTKLGTYRIVKERGVEEAAKDHQVAGHDPVKFDAMVGRVGQQAKEGPRTTVWDPVKRVYKTVPVNKK